MSQLLADARHGLRLMLRTPAVTVTAVLAPALAIGANTAMFSVVDAVLLRPLPFPNADELVMVWEDSSHVGFPRNTPAPAAPALRSSAMACGNGDSRAIHRLSAVRFYLATNHTR